MRVELRIERDEREVAVTVECDQAISPERAVAIVTAAIRDLLDEPFKLPHSS